MLVLRLHISKSIEKALGLYLSFLKFDDSQVLRDKFNVHARRRELNLFVVQGHVKHLRERIWLSTRSFVFYG